MHTSAFSLIRGGRSSGRRHLTVACNAIAAVALLLAALLPPSAAAATGAQLVASPASTTAGTTIIVSGSGLTKNQSGYVALDSAATGPAFRANSRGSFSVSLTLPVSETVGQHAVSARSTATSTLASTSVSIVSASSSPSPTPTPTATNAPSPTPTATQTPTSTATATPAATPTTAALTFPGPNGLVTNEFAFWNPSNLARIDSPDWSATSGSLFVRDGSGWTGVPDDVSPDATSSNGTDSAVFRLNTKRFDFGDVDVSFRLDNQGLVTTTRTPAHAYDGVHIWLRYQGEEQLYVATVNRRDGTAVIKKKTPGGPNPVNGGTYYSLVKAVPFIVPYGVWQQVRATVRTNPGGSVTIRLSVNGVLLLSATDDGSVGGPPITHPGAVGIRGDNCNFLFDAFSVANL